jgi:hypothetical protein
MKPLILGSVLKLYDHFGDYKDDTEDPTILLFEVDGLLEHLCKTVINFGISIKDHIHNTSFSS